MMAPSDFKQEQKGVAVAMGAAFVVTIVVIALVVFTDRIAASTPFVARLQFAIRADVFVVAWLAATIGNVARLRFFSERDISGSGVETQSNEVRISRAILENTSEQVGLAVVAHLGVAAVFAHANTLVAALVGLFAIGRLLFWAGYKAGGKGRAFGFALTFYPSVLALLLSVIAICNGVAA